MRTSFTTKGKTRLKQTFFDPLPEDRSIKKGRKKKDVVILYSTLKVFFPFTRCPLPLVFFFYISFVWACFEDSTADRTHRSCREEPPSVSVRVCVDRYMEQVEKNRILPREEEI